MDKSRKSVHIKGGGHSIFAAEYSEPSELLYYGKDGQFLRTIKSSAGVRQGSPLSSLFFCSLLQPMLETIVQEFPLLRVYAYIDDINFAAQDPQLITSAFTRLRGLLLLLLGPGRLSPKRCGLLTFRVGSGAGVPRGE